MIEPVIHRLFGVPVYATQLNREFSSEEMEEINKHQNKSVQNVSCLLYTSPSPRDGLLSRMPSSA